MKAGFLVFSPSNSVTEGVTGPFQRMLCWVAFAAQRIQRLCLS